MKTQRTQSQDKVLKLLKHKRTEFSAQALYMELRRHNQPLGLATIYRALDALKRSGVVQARLLSNGETFYSLTVEDRHHLTCLQCGTSMPIQEGDCPVYQLEKQLSKSAKFEIYYHTLEFFGLCSSCQLEQQNLANGE
jgi:Fur family ferric uptake transcriptional regulator